MQAPKNIKYVSKATEHKSSGIRFACSESAVREPASKNLQKQCPHADFEKAAALSNFRGLLTQGLQQGIYYSSNFYSNGTFLLP